MLQVTIPAIDELYDEETQEFTSSKEQILQLEHSLVSLSKWEAKWNKSFLKTKHKTDEESLDYIKCMTITKNVPSEVYNYMTKENISEIVKYIEEPMTATILPEDDNKTSRETITSELIYYWMIAFNIPVEFQKWHLNRLLTLINVCNIKNAPPKKRNTKELIQRNKALNEARKQALNTKG